MIYLFILNYRPALREADRLMVWSRGKEVNCHHLLSLECQLPNADQILCDFGEALLAFVPDEAWPVDEVLIYLLQSFLIVLAQSDLTERGRVKSFGAEAILGHPHKGEWSLRWLWCWTTSAPGFFLKPSGQEEGCSCC